MRASLPKAFAFAMRWEGGGKFHEVPGDPGGPTKWGVSLAAHPELGRQGIIDLTEEQARAIFLKDYWLPSGADTLPYPLDCVVADCAYNLGVDDVQVILPNARAVTEHLRDLFVALGAPYGADNLYRMAWPYLAAAVYVAGRLEKHEIVGIRQKKFLKGWKNRCYDALKTFM